MKTRRNCEMIAARGKSNIDDYIISNFIQGKLAKDIFQVEYFKDFILRELNEYRSGYIVESQLVLFIRFICKIANSNTHERKTNSHI